MHLFRPVNHILNNSLHPFKLRTHLRASANRSDSFIQARFLVRICQKSIADSCGPFGISSLLELDWRAGRQESVKESVVSRLGKENTTYCLEFYHHRIHEVLLR